jgi:enamine deaminase RidA (YjgF/YER057c/UK114 family)
MLMEPEAYQPRGGRSDDSEPGRRRAAAAILPSVDEIEIFNPPAVRAPGGTYSHVARVPAGAGLVVIAGQVGIGTDDPAAGDFDAQCAQAFANLGAALEAAGASWSRVIQTMTFLTRREDRPRLRAWRTAEYARLFPDGRYPPNTLLVVDALASDDLLIEVQALAAI